MSQASSSVMWTSKSSRYTSEVALEDQTLIKEKLIRKHLQHRHIKEIRGRGLMLAAIVENPEVANQLILQGQDEGLILFWLLFEPKAIRLTPPLTISEEEIIKACHIITSILDKI